MSVFYELYSAGKVQLVPLTQDQSDDIIKLMDTAVILMEGGTELDLKILDGDIKEDEIVEEAAMDESTPKEEEGVTEVSSEGSKSEIVFNSERRNYYE